MCDRVSTTSKSMLTGRGVVLRRHGGWCCLDSDLQYRVTHSVRSEDTMLSPVTYILLVVNTVVNLFVVFVVTSFAIATATISRDINFGHDDA